MAITNTSLHTRSISLPPTSHPLDASIEDHFRSLRATQAGSSSSSSICKDLCNIKDLYERINNLIHLPHNQKALCKGQIEEVLEGSLVLLDACSSALDAVFQMKESILDLQSSLRRVNTEEGFPSYIASRKRIIKMVSKSLADLRKADKSCYFESDAILLKEAEAITLSTLKLVLSFVMGKKVTSQTRGWSMVKKLVKSRRVPCESEKASEVEEMDLALQSMSEKQLDAETTKALLNKSEALEMVIRELEDGLESVSRCLVKTRVSLLNVFNH